MPASEQEKISLIQNQTIIERLRESFRPLERRLTPDVEPAAVYRVCAPDEDIAE
jgi:hypothetical protein